MSLFPPRYPILKEVIVSTKSGKSFQGVLWNRTGGLLVLRSVSLLESREKGLPLDGEIVLFERDVEFMQVT